MPCRLMLTIAMLGALVFTQCGCYPYETYARIAPGTGVTRVYEATPAEVWAVVPRVLDENNFKIRKVNKEEGWAVSIRRLFRNVYNKTLYMVVLVEDLGAGLCKVEFTFRNEPGLNHGIDNFSTYYFETELHKALRDELGPWVKLEDESIEPDAPAP